MIHELQNIQCRGGIQGEIQAFWLVIWYTVRFTVWFSLITVSLSQSECLNFPLNSPTALVVLQFVNHHDTFPTCMLSFLVINVAYTPRELHYEYRLECIKATVLHHQTSQIQTDIFIQRFNFKRTFSTWKWQHFFLRPFRQCYQHATGRWLSPTRDMTETINWRNGALAMDNLAHIVLMTSKRIR